MNLVSNAHTLVETSGDSAGTSHFQSGGSC